MKPRQGYTIVFNSHQKKMVPPPPAVPVPIPIADQVWTPRNIAPGAILGARVGGVALSEPAEQPHGARHGTLVDPFGHRWMLSQQIEQVPLDEYGARMRDEGVVVTGSSLPPSAFGAKLSSSVISTGGPSRRNAPNPPVVVSAVDG